MSAPVIVARNVTDLYYLLSALGNDPTDYPADLLAARRAEFVAQIKAVQEEEEPFSDDWCFDQETYDYATGYRQQLRDAGFGDFGPF